jgi:hypothetical protein
MLVLDSLSRQTCDTDVEALLEKCVVEGSSPKLYKIRKVIEVIEGLKAAGNRWAAVRKHAQHIVVIIGPKGNKCVNEGGLDQLLMSLKECELKTLTLSSRGHQIDKTRVREVTFRVRNKVTRIEVDYDTQRLAVHKTITLFEFSGSAADKHIFRIRNAHPELAAAIGDPIKINGVGTPTLCAGFETMLQIMAMLPSNDTVVEFRSKCTEDLIRQMKGDLTLIDEIKHNNAVLEETDVIVAVRKGTDIVKSVRGGGACKTCNRTETQNMIKRKIAELEELKTDALKRKAHCEQDFEEYASTQKRLRSQLLHLIV